MNLYGAALIANKNGERQGYRDSLDSEKDSLYSSVFSNKRFNPGFL